MAFFGYEIKKASSNYPEILTPGYTPSTLVGLMGKFKPLWLPMAQMRELNNVINKNPILYSVLNIRAKYMNNLRTGVEDIRTGKIYSKDNLFKDNEPPKIAVKMISLIERPNPLESRTEFMYFHSFSKDLYGNAQIYGNFDIGSKYDITTISTMRGLWPYLMTPVTTGRFLNQINVNGIIKEWRLSSNGLFSSKFKPEEILHRKDVNLMVNDQSDLVLGRSRAISLAMPLSTICVNYESLNVIGQERGMRAVISSSKDNPRLGKLPFTEDERKEVQEEIRQYGTMADQDQFMITNQPIDIFQLDQDVRKLGLLEQNAADGKIVSHAYSVPEPLLQMDNSGNTFENLNASEVRMYESAAKPELNDFHEDLNRWLKTEDYGFRYVTLCDHIDVLREDEKAKAIINRNNSVVSREIFKSGGCTFNEWRASIKWDTVTDWWGDMTLLDIYEKDSELANVILGTVVNNESTRSQSGVENSQT